MEIKTSIYSNHFFFVMYISLFLRMDFSGVVEQIGEVNSDAPADFKQGDEVYTISNVSPMISKRAIGMRRSGGSPRLLKKP